uniref:Uncharacterized protein n=1 Tax=Fagus sylvatica TaxID=28930 RepID=A0A2N9FEK6_FAGSY
MAKTCCSIETEPKTLNQGLLNRAREVAADVAQKMEPSEASTIFTEGIRPSFQEKEEEQLHKPVECEEKADITKRPCQCLSTTTIIESPDQVRPREPLSAPF